MLIEENRHTEAGGVGGESWSFDPHFVLSPPSTFCLSRPIITLQNSTGRCVVATSHPSMWHKSTLLYYIQYSHVKSLQTLDRHMQLETRLLA